MSRRRALLGSPPSTGPVSVERLADQAELEAQDPETERIRGGFALARNLLLLVGFVLLLIALFAALTYPGPGDVTALLAGEGGGGGWEAYRELRAEWFASVKDLLQLLVVSLLVPLLATLVGYIFGRQAEGASSSS